MKSMTKLMVVAMILAAALVVAPAAARVVNPGDTVYVGEENINFAGVSGVVNNIRYVHISGSFSDWNIDNTILAGADGNVSELTESAVGTKTGTYYVIGTGLSQDATRYINIQYPDVALDVVLNDSRKDSVAGKSVTRNTKLAFKLTNNIVVEGAKMNIEVTLPGGGVVTKFDKLNLKDRTVDGTTQYFGPLDLSNAEAGTYTAVAKWPSESDFYGKGYDSKPVTFEVSTKSLTITSDKDTVVRGNSFTVTITGESKETYKLYIKDVSGLNKAEYPQIVEGQNGVKDIGNVTGSGVSPINATIETNAGGTRSVQFDTNTNTDDRQFTIRVQDLTDPSTYDEVKVRVEEGDVTITASGTGVYYIGEEVTLSGTCTDNETTVHLFITGPNLPNNGADLVEIKPVINGNTGSFTTEDVEGDDTWSYKWNTADLGKSLDAGGYTIYAASKPVDKDHLSDAKYATASIQLRSGFITATSSGAVVAKGDDLTLTGTAQGDPDSVHVWIFGKNLQMTGESATVEDDGTFEYELKNTRDLSAGQYFVIIQHPMMNGQFDIFSGAEGWINGTAGSGFDKVEIGKLQASDAATAVINALDSANIDDTYVKLTFVVEEAQIFIDAIGDKAAGSKFTITGTTNLAVGDALNVEVTSAAFQPTSKSEASGFGSVAGVVNVQQGDGANTWSFEVDGASFKPDQYIVTVESIDTDTTATATFNVVEAVPTTQTTPVETTPVETTPVETQTTEPTPTQSPGFGALLALAGLGAVAFLVLRRD
ncbi:major cell surface glycoprotein [Methanoculleus chikugoensis]|uniref:Major cell surface glycoprotein n=1 Tax=Methanoculleus chikugoensis TaxID=118126 RepID=A0A1M4MNP3_9EURY|nr:MEMAR_RS02690 family S-layer glycoprotein [Methanoculleus chikugoensis]SCL76486.1 major cell surface glycoprotein [Methanoculleus chikugoensis]